MATTVTTAPEPGLVTPKRALLSVCDKTGLAGLARALADHGIELVSTGGTGAALAQAGLRARDVADLTGFPEIMNGRVKTLHPAVHGGLLADRDNPRHLAAAAAHAIGLIDIAIIDVYPFETVRAQGGDFADSIETIDIGGPAMIRAAAKNHAFVAVLTGPDDYDGLLEELSVRGGALTRGYRARMAAAAFARTAAYDAAVARWLADELSIHAPRHRNLAGTLKRTMRHGENPHQTATLYVTGDARPGVANAILHQGKPLSWNNVNDADAAFELVSEFPDTEAVCAIVKHASPCGVASGCDPAHAHARAFEVDPDSAFGGIAAFNRPLDAAAARAILGVFTEVVIAPDASEEARAILASKKNLRLLTTGDLAGSRTGDLTAKTVAGGLLVQSRDNAVIDDCRPRTVTGRQPTEKELADLGFAWRVVKHARSNAIVCARGGVTIGIGAGQTSRVEAARIAAAKASARAGRGFVVASDAFFPFADGLDAVAQAGATAVIQPGGSVRDDEVIAAANGAGIAMVMTGMRHFRH